MTNFVLISAALVAVFLIPLLIVLLRKPATTEIDNTREQNIAIARERLAEFEKAQAAGELSDEEFAQAKQDLQIALAEDIATETSTTANSQHPYATLLLLVVGIPIFVTLFYQQIGAPEHLAISGPAEPPPALDQLPPVEELVAELEKRLQENPDNAQGWFLLGRTYMQLGQPANAVRAYRQLHQLLPSDATAKLSLADALAMQNNGRLPTQAITLLEEALTIQPDSANTLWLLGQAAVQQNQPDKAIGYWQRAYPLLASQPQAQQQLGELLAELQTSDNLVKPNTPEPDSTTRLFVEVTLAAELSDQVSPQDSVFIYAKAAQGPPMPLAVARKMVADLPIKIHLDDSMAMLPQMRLSNFAQVRVGARISKSGQANAQKGDLQSSEVAVANSHAETIQLLINRPITE